MADIRQIISLPPTETIAAFRARGHYVTQARWDEAWQDEHARAFTVTKVMDAQLLARIRGSLDKVVSQGGTFEQWKAGIVPVLKDRGWYGRVDDAELTGVDHAIFVGDRRLRTIYDTNLRMSRAAGQWQRIQALKARAPFLMYDAVNDRRTRPLHRIWGGLDTGRPIILPVDHPFWTLYYPPCGWGCRCGVIQLSQRDLDRRGLRVTTEAELVALDVMTAAGQPGGTRRPFRRSTGVIELVPAGIDPGFAYNTGAAPLAGVAQSTADAVAEVAKSSVPTARALLIELVDSPAFERFLAEPAAAFPVMVLDDAMQRTIAARTAVVRLSADDAIKQARKHADVPVEVYRSLPALGEAPTIVGRDLRQDTHFYFLAPRDGYWLVAVVKRTVSGEAVFLNSLRVQGETSLAKLLAQMEIMVDARQ